MSELNHPTQINRDYIRLLQVMRRFVKEEFSISIRMTQEDAVEQLLQYAQQSRNNVLQEMGKELREFTYVPEAPEPAPGSETAEEGVRYYRGAPIADKAGNGKAAAAEKVREETAPQSQHKPTRIYRGRVING